MKKHYLPPGYTWLPACKRLDFVKYTSVKEHVTCGNCKRTRIYREN